MKECPLENAVNDHLLQHTNFYLEAQAMTDKPNTWPDISAQYFYLTPHGLSQILRSFLEWQPEHVLFGTDAGGVGADAPLFQWEELAGSAIIPQDSCWPKR
jgi:predicted TIM-barrel fold metal-dependent hydrolase